MAACWVWAAVWELVWRGEGETRSGGKTAGWSAIHREGECQEGWECWEGRAPTPPALGVLVEAVGVGGSGRG